MVSVDQGTTISLVGENKITPGNGITGAPSQTKGVYGFIGITATFPNDFISDKSSTVDPTGQTKISGASGSIQGKAKYQMFLTATAPNDIFTERGNSNQTDAVLHTMPRSTTPAQTTYYKVAGYYSAGSVWEGYITTTQPTSSTTINPNTGHTLINSAVTATWTA